MRGMCAVDGLKFAQRYFGSHLAGVCENGSCTNKAQSLYGDKENNGMQLCFTCERKLISEGNATPGNDAKYDKTTGILVIDNRGIKNILHVSKLGAKEVPRQ